MERKENDLLMSMVANPSFQLEDFATVGFNMNNTSLLDKSVYRNNETIQKTFSDENGKFNEKLFNDFYNKALVDYNVLATTEFMDLVKNLAIFDKDNIYAPAERRKEGPNFKLEIILNPDRINTSIYRLGLVGERTRSRAELAQADKVLLNPTEVANGAEAKWGDAPNDNFWGYFFDTLVIALYDEDGTHIDPVTGQEVERRKGEYKIGENGSYYYERLDGREVYGRQVLNKMDVLTTDGSKANKYDFFDSDDIKLKSIGGSILKNAALVGTMFIPYVGPVIAGLSVATQLAGLVGTIGKMASGSDSPTFSELEGWAKSMNRLTAKTEEAANTTWCWENFINLIGDVAGLLKEQRFIFEKIPAAVKGGYAGSEAGQAKMFALFTADAEATTASEVAKIKSIYGSTSPQALKATSELLGTETLRAQASLDSWIKGYNKLGEVLSKGYMTAITVGDTYGEAKLAGATDTEATILTLGYAAGEYAILNTGIGEWILPELRASRYKSEAIAKAITLDMKKISDEIAERVGPISNLPKEEKKRFFQKIFNLGKGIATAEYANGVRTGTGLAKASLAGGLGEGVEETTEEILADFAKGCYNTYAWLRDKDSRMSSFGFEWEDGERKFNSKELFDRYSMSFIGGIVGGSLTNLGTSYKMLNTEFTPESARQLIVYMAREGLLDDIRKAVSRLSFGNKNLSATKFLTINNKIVAEPGTVEDNQDTAAKAVIYKYLDFVENTLKAHGSTLSDDSFLNTIFKDMRYYQLYNSEVAALLLQDFNTYNSNILKTVELINALDAKAKDKNGDGVTSDKEEHTEPSINAEEERKELEKKLKELKQLLKDLVEGKNSDRYIGAALFEMIPELNLHLVDTTFPMFVKHRYNGRSISELSEVEKQEALDKYKSFENWDKKEKIFEAAFMFLDVVKEFSQTLLQLNNTYTQSELTKRVTDTLTYLYSNLNYGAVDMNNATTVFGTESLLDAVAKAFAPDLYKSYVDLHNNAVNAIDSTLPKVELARQLKALNNDYRGKIEALVSENLEQVATEFIQQGFVNSDIKSKLEKVFTKILNNLNTREGEIREDQGLDPEAPTLYTEQIKRLTKVSKLFSTLSNSPWEANLDLFSILVLDAPVKVSELIARIDTLLHDNRNDLSLLDMSTELVDEITNALRIINFYLAAINASKVDNAGLNNIWGFTKTLNEVSSKIGKESNLAEIDSLFANVLIHDLNNVKEKLIFMKNLYLHNKGNKLAVLDKTAANTWKLVYNKLKTIVQVPDEDKEIESWPAFIAFLSYMRDSNKFSILQKLSDNPSLSLNEKEKTLMEKEIVGALDALYDFLNDPIFDDPNNLKKFFNIRRFNRFAPESKEILNAETLALNDLTFLNFIAARGAVKTSSFLSRYKTVVNPEKGIAPVLPLELAIFNNYANTINGDFVSRILRAYTLNVEEEYTSANLDKRIVMLKGLGWAVALAQELSKDENLQIALLSIQNTLYDHIVLTEGIAGSGKTSAVLSITHELLNKYHTELTDNVFILHCADDSNLVQSKKLQDNLGAKGEAFNIKSFFEFFTDDYTTEITDTSYSKVGNRIVSNWKIKQSLSSVPSIIVIDEVGKLSGLELSFINKLATELGITVLAAGDFDLSKYSLKIELSKTSKGQPVNYTLTPNARHFVSSYKLGLSLRTDNSVKTNNNNSYLYWKNTNRSNPLTLLYFIDTNNNLYGDRVINIQDPDYINLVVELVRTLIGTLDKSKNEKITYIADRNSTLYKALMVSGIEEYLDIVDYNNALGRENRYYITEVSGNLQNSDPTHDLIYTGITRALLGSILVCKSTIFNLTSTPALEMIDEREFKELVPKYAKARQDRLTALFPNEEEIEYKPRDLKDTPLSQPTVAIKTITYDNLKTTYSIEDYTFSIDSDGVEIPMQTLRIPLLVTSTDSNGNTTITKFDSNIFNIYDGNTYTPITLVKIGDYVLPFYMDANKVWVPFFGIDANDNFILNSSLNNQILENISKLLGNRFLGDLNTASRLPQVPKTGEDAKVWIDAINVNYNPSKSILDNITESLNTLAEKVEALKPVPLLPVKVNDTLKDTLNDIDIEVLSITNSLITLKKPNGALVTMSHTLFANGINNGIYELPKEPAIDDIAKEIRLKAGMIGGLVRQMLHDIAALTEGGLKLDNLPPSAAFVDSKGLTKGNYLEDLLYLLTNGVDPSRPFHTAPLGRSENAAGTGAGLGTAGGTSVREGWFIVAGELNYPDSARTGTSKFIKDTGIKTVLINDGDSHEFAAIMKKVKEQLASRFPDVDFILYSEAAEYYNNKAKELGIISEVEPEVDDSLTPDTTINDLRTYLETLDSYSRNPEELQPSDTELGMLLHSFNVLELGALYDEDGNIIPDVQTNSRGELILMSDVRIDGYNGLIKIEEIVRNTNPNFLYYVYDRNSGISQKDYYLDKIAQLQMAIMSMPNKSGIIDFVTNFLGFTPKNITFAIKTSPTISDKTRNDPNKDYVGLESLNSTGIYLQNKNEKSEHNPAGDYRSNEVIPHKMIALMLDEYGNDILEIPLFTLTNPIILLKTLEKYKELLTAWLSYGDLAFYKKCDKIILDFLGKSEYRNILNLFRLFRFNYSGIFRIFDYSNPSEYSDWTPAKNLNNLGLYFSGKKGHYSEVLGFNHDMTGDNYINISEFAKDPRFTVSTKVFGISSALVIPGVSNSEDLIKVGHPFVLVGTSDLHTDDQLWDYYVRQLSENIPQKVKVMYVIPPVASFLEYLQSVNNKINGDPESRDIGNLYTSFQILKILWDKGKVKDKLNYEYYGDILDRTKWEDFITSLLDYLTQLYIDKKFEELNEALKTLVDYMGERPLLGTVLTKILVSLASNQRNTGNLTLDPALMLEISDNLGNYTIYYRGNRMTINSPKLSGTPLIEVNQDSNYTIEGRPYTVNGKIDSPTFEGDMANIIGLAVSRILTDRRYPYSLDHYIRNRLGDSYLELRKLLKEFYLSMPTEVRTIIDEILEATYSTKNIDSLQWDEYTLENVLDSIIPELLNSGYIAFKLGDKIIISSQLSNHEDLDIYPNLEITDSIIELDDTLKQPDGTYKFIINSYTNIDGEATEVIYNAVYNPITNKIEIVELIEEEAVTITPVIAISEEVFAAKQQILQDIETKNQGTGFKGLLRDRKSGPYSYLEFIPKLLNLAASPVTIKLLEQGLNALAYSPDSKEYLLLRSIIDILKIDKSSRTQEQRTPHCPISKFIDIL